MSTDHLTTWLARAAIVGGVGSALLGLRRWWSERERPATGYVRGQAVAITVTAIDGKPVEVATARAYRSMRDAAAQDKVTIKIINGFRTMAEQQYLYDCYRSGGCNNGNLAAKPGHSNHQSGHALDLNARDPAVGTWLRAHAHEFGFRNTVASEPWHWEYWP